MIHTFEPVFNEHSRILILGTFPSVKSREGNFYYHHPQNRFWKVMSNLLETQIPVTIDEKKMLLLSHGIALWDVIYSCDIIGSSDNSITNVIPNDISWLLQRTRIDKVITNGNKANELYQEFCKETVHIEAIKLPSTSPANAAYSLDKLVKTWGQVVLRYHDGKS